MTTTTTSLLADFVGAIAAPDPKWLKQARSHLDNLTKPLGSLGRLEDIAARFVAIRNGEIDGPLKKAAYVFAADHGIVAEGVSAYPKEVTRQMVLNFLQQGAAINVLANLHETELTIVDVGVDADFGDLPGLLHRKVRSGTRNMLHEPAMSEEAGLEKSAQDHKVRVVDAILRKHFAENLTASQVSPLEVLRCVGGLEIAAMVGLVLGAARYRIPIVTDGFISTAAAALAYAVEPRVKDYLFAGHRAEEPGHRFLLEYLRLDPILTLNMRLGEGTGAVLAMPIIESALRLYTEMATFASAGVSEARE
jgi:nicotinate-nucleotide--dimethylbenzimidazole phosphoribosyltransferase